jgi:DNA-directed RNA polymerase specialized sigma24 family protein
LARRANYRPEYVRQLVEGYAALVSSADTTATGLRYLVELADLDRALARLSHEYREVVYWHGIRQLPQEDAAFVLQKSQSWVSKRYRDALEDLTYWINGGD